jgi:NAD(P)-dependent dehydrogenase (short-subunit alcohol dehydrogenase family)
VDLRLTGKIALVTGSTAGIGFAIAKALASDGAHVYVNGRTQERVDVAVAVQLLAPVARRVLTEMNTSLLFDTGQLTETGLRRTADGGLTASWTLSWPEQQAAGVEPIALQAYFGGSFHHPHLRGTTVHDWPLNVFTDEDAAAQLSIFRAIVSSDLHNLVYLADDRIVPAMTARFLVDDGQTGSKPAFGRKAG